MKAYRLLLLLYPRSFRRRYGAEMVDAHRALLERTRREAGVRGETSLWAKTILDTLRSGVGERVWGRSPDDGEGEGTMKTVRFHVLQALRKWPDRRRR